MFAKIVALLVNLTAILPIIQFFLQKRSHEIAFNMLEKSRKSEREIHKAMVDAIRADAPESYVSALERELQYQQSITADIKRQL